MRILTDDEFQNFRKHVKCKWLTCFAGMGLAGRGDCSANGRWDRKECPEYISEAEYLAKWKAREEACKTAEGVGI